MKGKNIYRLKSQNVRDIVMQASASFPAITLHPNYLE